MNLVDSNLLIYAHADQLAQHESARDWLDEQLTGTAPVALPWPSLLAFVRIVTNPRIFSRAERIADAWAQVLAWLACEPAWIPRPGEHHTELLGQILSLPGLHANDVPDADLAALAIEHDLILCSADSGFARFPGLRWFNPLVT